MALQSFIESYLRENHPHIQNTNENYITDAIKAGYYFAKGENKNDDGDDGVSEVSADNLYLLNKILGKANLIFDAKDLDWEEKYDLIFSDNISKRVYHLFDWYDPDTSYEEDVTYFMNAFREDVEHRNKLSKYTHQS